MSEYPAASLLVIGDYPPELKLKLELDSVVKSRLVKLPVTPAAAATPAFVAIWKTSYEGPLVTFFNNKQQNSGRIRSHDPYAIKRRCYH
jgi:hypothetical protein